MHIVPAADNDSDEAQAAAVAVHQTSREMHMMRRTYYARIRCVLHFSSLDAADNLDDAIDRLDGLSTRSSWRACSHIYGCQFVQSQPCRSAVAIANLAQCLECSRRWLALLSLHEHTRLHC